MAFLAESGLFERALTGIYSPDVEKGNSRELIPRIVLWSWQNIASCDLDH
jgi:hypothetical protein